MRLFQDAIKDAKIDLIICDEGHRLKNDQIKTTNAVKSLQTTRRIVLTGTPIQNNLSKN
jgi:SNF2 family DNA or RNA helicase